MTNNAASSSSQRLWDACRHGDTNLAETLIIEHGADITFTDESFGATPLMVACTCGNSDTASMLIVLGADINAVSVVGREEESFCTGRTALHIACTVRSLATLPMIEMMLDWGSNPAMVDGEGRTAIDTARAHMSTNVLTKLEQSCSVISRDIDRLVVTHVKKRWPSRGTSSISSYHKVHVEIIPVMSQAGASYGEYSHKMLWYNPGDHQPLGFLSLAQSTVHAEECAGPPHRFHIVVRRAHDDTSGLPLTFGLESEQAAVGFCRTLHTLCGSFTATPPPPPPPPPAPAPPPSTGTGSGDGVGSGDGDGASSSSTMSLATAAAAGAAVGVAAVGLISLVAKRAKRSSAPALGTLLRAPAMGAIVRLAASSSTTTTTTTTTSTSTTSGSTSTCGGSQPRVTRTTTRLQQQQRRRWTRPPPASPPPPPVPPRHSSCAQSQHPPQQQQHQQQGAAGTRAARHSTDYFDRRPSQRVCVCQEFTPEQHAKHNAASNRNRARALRPERAAGSYYYPEDGLHQWVR